MSNHVRILVRLQRHGESGLASFTNCILNYFGHTSGCGKVHIQLKDNRLTLSDTKLSAEDEVEIKHPAFCPMHHLSPEVMSTIPEEILTRGVDVGAAIVLESCDGKVLLTRRSQNLRIFPGLWVPPGGHVDDGETLMEAGLRELEEETGLHLQSKDCVNSKIDLLALWESVYPPVLTAGPPKRHHIVVYFHAKLVPGLTSDKMEHLIKFNPGEVDACAWFDRDMVTAIARTFDEDFNGSTAQSDHLPTHFKALILNKDLKQVTSDFSCGPLLNVYSENEAGVDCERVSTGTKFALQHYLRLKDQDHK